MKENYPVFVKWMNVLDWILDRVEKFPKAVRYTFGNRMVELSLYITESIIEAIYTKERQYILTKTNLYIEKLRVFFRLSYKRRYISARQFEFISSRLDEIGKMIGGWRRADEARG